MSPHKLALHPSELPLTDSNREEWQVLIKALEHNFNFRARACTVEVLQMPELFLLITQPTNASAELVKACVEEWLAVKSWGEAGRLLHFLFDSPAERSIPGPSRADSRLTEAATHAEGAWAVQ